MNKPLPWNVKGVGFDAREAARLAAKRAGVPLGEWLNGIIATRAAELGVQVDDVEAEDRLDAIATRLFETEDATAGAPRDESDKAWWRDRASPDRVGRGALPMPKSRDGADEVSQPRDAPREGDAVRATLSPTAAPDRTPATTLLTQPMPVRSTAAVPSPGSAPRTEAWRRGVPPRFTPAAGASQADAERLDERLNAILAKLNRSFEAAAEISDSFTGRAESADRSAAPHADAAKISAKIRPAAADAAPPAGPDRAATPPDLHGAFRALSEKLDAQLGADKVPAPGGDSGPVGRMERPRRADKVPARDADRGREHVLELQGMRRELTQLSTQVADLAPQRSLASLDAAVRELAGRLDLLRLDGVEASLLAPVERLGHDMRQAILATDATAAVEAVRRDMAGLGSKLEAQLARGPDARAIEAFRGELRELRGGVSAMAERITAGERLEDEVASLSKRMDTVADRVAPAASRELAQAVGDVRRLLKAFDPEAGLGAIDQKIDRLSARVESMAGRRDADPSFADMMRMIDRAHEALVERLGGRGVTPGAISGIEENLGALTAKIDAMSRAAPDMDGLYALVGNLAERMQDARDPQADARALAALQAQIGRLVERFDRSDADAATLGGLERLIGDLFLQIEQSRNAAIDAAENAARAAAQDTLRAAMNNPALNGAELTVQTGLDVDHVSGELADLRRVQEASDRRITGTLTALNTTLERLVDHMVATLPPTPLVAETPPAAPVRRRRATPDTAASETRAASDLPPFDPERFLLEPGAPEPEAPRTARAGEPAAPVPQVGDDGAAGVAPLIAAARRAAQAAQQSALEASLKAQAEDGVEPLGREPGKVRSFFSNRRRPLLLALAGVVLLIGTLQIVRISTGPTPADGRTAEAPATPETPPPAAGIDKGANKDPDKGASLPVTPTVREAAVAPSTLGPIAATDPTPTGSLPPAKPVIDAVLAGLPPALRDQAVGGSAAAQFEVGSRLSDGKGVTRDPKAAAAWFERAAGQGLAPAQYRLGSIYEKGVGVATDPALALAWYEKAARQGNVRAMHNLAVMSAEGAGAKPDYGKAVTWFTKAASYGVRDSQYNLAVLFARGLGVPQSLDQSYSWFALAAQQGDADAVTKRDTVAAKLDPKALGDAKNNVASFHALVPDPTVNDVAAPPGGWDAATSGKTASARKTEARVSSM